MRFQQLHPTANEVMLGPTRLRKAQLADPVLRPVLSWLEDLEAPPTADALRLESRQTKAYAAQWPQLVLKQGVLLRRFVATRRSGTN